MARRAPHRRALSFVILINACASIRGQAHDTRCSATADSLPVGSSASELAGTFRVLFIGTEGSARRKRLTASLFLQPHDSSRRYAGKWPHLNPHLEFPLYGSLDADVRQLGAIPPGRADSLDPDRPGVNVWQMNAVYEGRPFTEISLQVGDEGNRRDAVTLDGADFSMQVHRITTTGFRGTWSSSVGMTTFRAEGHFCAWRS